MTQLAPASAEVRRRHEPVAEMPVLWFTAGLGCDGDTIAVTGATQPSIEELVLGAFPWIPKVRLHNPFLAYENGDEFVRLFRDAVEGKIGQFILVVEGSIPNEHNKPQGYWATFTSTHQHGRGSRCPAQAVTRFASPCLEGPGRGTVRDWCPSSAIPGRPFHEPAPAKTILKGESLKHD